MHKLKDLCRTCWVERIDALDGFQTLHPSIVSCMENISIEGSSKWTPDTITGVSTLSLAITTTDFLSALVSTASLESAPSSGCDYLLSLKILPSLLHPSILFNCFYTCLWTNNCNSLMYCYCKQVGYVGFACGTAKKAISYLSCY